MKIKNWNSINVDEAGNSAKLQPGIYELKIVDAVDFANEEKPYLLVYFDIVFDKTIDTEGTTKAYAGYFQERQDAFPDSKWGGTIRLYYTEKALKLFKSRIIAIEKSNPGYSFEKANFDEKTLKGKVVVGIFVEREYSNNNGSIKTTVSCDSFRSIDAWKKGDIKIPESKTLEKKEEPKIKKEESHKLTGVIADDEDLPF